VAVHQQGSGVVVALWGTDAVVTAAPCWGKGQEAASGARVVCVPSVSQLQRLLCPSMYTNKAQSTAQQAAGDM
jgi:hypothetical protein